MILLVDNNDSFTYNILQLLRAVAADRRVVVCRSQDVASEEVGAFDHIIFSPGPGSPDDFPVMHDILSKYDSAKSILGICLGHQAICQHYGAQLKNLDEVCHGQSSNIRCDCRSLLFDGVEQMTVGRYHSWVAQALPKELRITAVDQMGTVMAVEHLSKRIYGVQFHPESYMTKGGDIILRNFINGIS